MSEYNVKYEWSKLFNFVIKVKHKYLERFGTLDTFKFDKWIQRLGEDDLSSTFGDLDIKQHGSYIQIKSTFQFDEQYEENCIYRQANSIVIDLVREEIVIAPPKRIFAFKETEETSSEKIAELIRAGGQIEISNMLDGKAIFARGYGKRIFISTKDAMVSSESWYIQEATKMFTTNIQSMISDNREYTFAFVMIHPEDNHIVRYEKAMYGLHLVGVVDNQTGDELYYDAMKYIAAKYKIQMAVVESKALPEIILDALHMRRFYKKGWIVNIEGFRFKILCKDYLDAKEESSHRSNVSLNTVIEAMASSKLDDLLRSVKESDKSRVLSYIKTVQSYCERMNDRIFEWYSNAPKDSRKEFMVWVQQNVPEYLQTSVRNLYCGHTYTQYDILRRGTSSFKTAEELGIGEDSYATGA